MNLRAPRYLTEFRCLAQDCPDTCCAGFTVRLSSSDLVRMKTAATAQELSKAVKPEKDDDGDVASMKQGHACHFLRPDRLCSLIARKGDDAVPDACAMYPRTLSYFPDRIELHATAACPEIARTLLTSDRALELVPADATIGSRIDPAPGKGVRSPYTARREEVLDLFDDLLQGATPLRDRLSRLARFAGRVTPFFHATSKKPHDDWAAAVSELRETPAPIHTADRALGAQILFGTLMNLRDASMPRYSALLDAILGVYHRALPPSADDRMFAALAEVSAEKAKRIDAAFGPELDRMLARHLRNEWRRVWFTSSPNLASHLFKQLVEAAAIRLMLIAHPALEERAANGQPLMPEAVIDVVQIVTRRLSSSPGMLDSLEESLTAKALEMDEAARLELLIGLAWPAQ